MDEIPCFYQMYGETMAEEYARPSHELYQQLERGCARSEFQFLTHEKIEAMLDNQGGVEFPDFMNYEQIPLISDKFHDILNYAGIDNLFYKPIIFQDSIMGIMERYWLALPPRIRCLNYRASLFQDARSPLPRAEKIVVNPSKVGNYQIFCIEEVINRDIIVTQELEEIIEKNYLTNVYFKLLEE